MGTYHPFLITLGLGPFFEPPSCTTIYETHRRFSLILALAFYHFLHLLLTDLADSPLSCEVSHRSLFEFPLRLRPSAPVRIKTCEYRWNGDDFCQQNSPRFPSAPMVFRF